DTGRGIAGPDLSKVFEPFYTTKGVGEGTGLGMAIVYKIIVENHHGKIDIKSKLGEGTEVMMTLPQRQQNTEKGVLYARRKSL
ncbi:MAG: HAMP domain-containing histidine kinase, partial [Nitrospirae bacterium]|nr:HAMP domain-containing histidine kinase [Nitrospirota bacterium]